MSAQQLVDNQYFNNLVEKMTRDIFDEWRSASTIEDRERLYQEKLAIEKIHTSIINQATRDATPLVAA